MAADKSTAQDDVTSCCMVANLSLSVDDLTGNEFMAHMDYRLAARLKYEEYISSMAEEIPTGGI